MYYVFTIGRGEVGVRKCHYLVTFSIESNHKGEEGQNIPNLDYIIQGWSLRCLKVLILEDNTFTSRYEEKKFVSYL